MPETEAIFSHHQRAVLFLCLAALSYAAIGSMAQPITTLPYLGPVLVVAAVALLLLIFSNIWMDYKRLRGQAND